MTTTHRSPLPHVPCRRPHVTIEAHPKQLTNGDTATYHLVTCNVAGCDWTYDAAVATDAAAQAKWHRSAHRTAVPETRVYQLPAGPNFANRGYTAECECGWHSPEGTVTRSDNDASLAAHLANAHGLVS